MIHEGINPIALFMVVPSFVGLLDLNKQIFAEYMDVLIESGELGNLLREEIVNVIQ